MIDRDDDPYAHERAAAREARDAQDFGSDMERPTRQELAAEEAADRREERNAPREMMRDRVTGYPLTRAGHDLWRVEDGAPF